MLVSNTPQSVVPLSLDQALQQALAHHQAGRWPDAERLYRAILTAQADQPDANHYLGTLALQVGQPAAALPYLKVALQAKPARRQYWLSYVDALIRAGCFDVASELLTQGRQQGLHGTAVDALVEQLAASGAVGLESAGEEAPAPAQPTAADTAALVAMFGERRYAEAESRARAMTLRFPAHGFAWQVLGAALQQLGRRAEALSATRKAAALLPENAEVHYNLGTILKHLGRLAEAEAAFRCALAIRPDYVDVLSNLGGVLKDQGRLDEAEASYRRALAIRPDFPEAHSNLLFTMNYSAGRDPAHCLQEARDYGRMAARRAARFSAWPLAVAAPARLRVGLVSGDLCNHPVGYFLEGLLAQLADSSIDLIAYPSSRRSDALTERIRPHFAAWQPLAGLGDEAAARLIHADGVHVLLDLSGHTAHNRLPVFAWKPAPVQASWLGYFATSGVAEIDYLLVDALRVPKTQQDQFVETLWYLPDTRLCFTAPDGAPPISSLPAPACGYVTFGCFQNLAKLSDRQLMLWGQILQARPGARLRLQCKQLADPALRIVLTQRLQRSGIDPARVAMHGAVERTAYLAAYAEVDMVLDTFPYPGGTTTSEALWMGVPTLTLAGDTMLSRLGASLLTCAGLPDWVTSSEAEYVERAVALSRDLVGLAALRGRLREQVRGSPLFDTPRFAAHLENALWGMWLHAGRRSSPEAAG